MLAEDGLAVPLYVLEPDPPDAKLSVCIAAHGHGPGKIIPGGIARDEAARHLIESGERDYGLQAVCRGYQTMIPDLRVWDFFEAVLPDA